jgi:hypothetical protein
MKFTCIDSTEMDGILIKGKQYTGERAYHRNFVKIFRCDDKVSGFFELSRFEEVKEVVIADEVNINHYSVEVEKR